MSVAGGGVVPIVFLWQIPHFMPSRGFYRDDYGKAGFPLLPVIEPDGAAQDARRSPYAAALVPASLIPVICRPQRGGL